MHTTVSGFVQDIGGGLQP